MFLKIVCLLLMALGVTAAEYRNATTILRAVYDTCAEKGIPLNLGDFNGQLGQRAGETQNIRDLCQLPQKRGRCKARKTRYFYNAVSGSCEEFIYGGCDGNANRFLSADNCESVCRGNLAATEPTTTPVAVTARIVPDECHLPPLKGPCYAMVKRWYYDNIEQICKEFIYGGCRGNANSFTTKGKCQMVCNFHMEAACRPGYSKVGGKCFKFFNFAMDFPSARHACNSVDAKLAYIPDQRVLNAVITYLGEEQKDYWVGAERIGNRKHLWTEEGANVPVASELWATGKPDDPTGQLSCVYMQQDNNMYLDDDSCNQLMYYICEATE